MYSKNEQNKLKNMYTGIYGDIVGVPAESIFLYLIELRKENKINYDLIKEVRKIIQTKIYYVPIIDELFKIVSPDLMKDYFEKYSPEKRKYRFSDDTVCMIATMDAILSKYRNPDSKLDHDYIFPFKEKYFYWGNKYFEAGNSELFRNWLKDRESGPYYGFGNGAAMRIAPIGYISNTNSFIQTGIRSCFVTHNHPEAIRGGLAVIDAIATALKTKNMFDIKKKIQETYFYDLSRTLKDIRPSYKFYAEAKLTVPESIIAFLESTSAIHAVENAISLGGDTDTQAMIAGCIADAYYGKNAVVYTIQKEVEQCLPDEMLLVIQKFYKEYVL